jgi:hypothetical protein
MSQRSHLPRFAFFLKRVCGSEVVIRGATATKVFFVGLVVLASFLCFMRGVRAETFDHQFNGSRNETGGDVDWSIDDKSHVTGQFTNVGRFDLHINGQSTVTVTGNAAEIYIHGIDGQSTINLGGLAAGSVRLDGMNGQSIVFVNVNPGGRFFIDTVRSNNSSRKSYVCYVTKTPAVSVVGPLNLDNSELIPVQAGKSCPPA